MTSDEFDEMEVKLANWRRTVLSGSGGTGHCGSVEGRYRPRRPDEEQRARIFVDELAGWFVESVWRTLRPRQKWLLKWHYVYRFERFQVIRMVLKRCGYGIRSDRYNGEVRLGVELLKKALDERVRREYASRHNSIPPFGVCMAPLGALARPDKVEAEPATAR